MKASPEPLWSPKARIAPVPLRVVARAGRRVVAVEQVRIGARLAVGADQRAVRHLLAALARHQHLALGHDRGGEVEHQRILARPRNADAVGRGREAAVDAAIRRHQHAARGVDEVDRHQPLGRRHLRPVADPADMAGVAQGHGGEAVLLALVDADADRLRRHRLAEAVLAVDHGDHRRVDHDLDRDVGHDGAVLLLRGIARHAHHAVAVVAREVGAHQVAADAAALVLRAAGRGKDVRDEGLERLRLDGDGHASALRALRDRRRSRGSRSG